ncbi:hypothetical protein [Paenibacillus nasutitermitis]|uniref:Uncharacterized protein n=1 Tax=Paenibacillus nasutitermitis TaxID=1652958 RepID=A0A916YJJ0_9BACL|nr:hypothetical protein [Paenibacillus nasutitermitis]GGD48829.1 hypothetical protein GCM10010911_02940 [Paenibacillus nasutitermitis]
MRSLILQIRFELRMLVKQRWPLLLPPAAGAWMILQCLDMRHFQSTDLNLYAAEAHSLIMMFITAVPVLLGVLLIRRDTLHASYEWSLGLPVTNRVIIASKWTAGFLYMSVSTLMIQLGYAALAWHHALPLESALHMIVWYTLFYEMSFAAGIALGLVLGALMPLRFSLPIAFCGWVFGALFLPALMVDNMHWYPVKVFSLNHLLSITVNTNNEVWTFDLAGREYILMFFFVAAFSLFMLTAAGARLACSRPVYRANTPMIIMLLGLLFSAAVYVPYGWMWYERYTQQHIMIAAAKNDAQIDPHELYQFRIDSMILDLTRQADNSLDILARIELPTQKGSLIPASETIRQVKRHFPGQVTFLLDPLLEINAMNINGKPASWRRDGDFVSFDERLLESGRQNHIIEIHYGGTINEWRSNGGSETQFAFVQGSNVLLPAHLGWFPIPGGDTLKLYTGTYLSDRVDVVKGLRTHFDITLRGFPGPVYASIAAAADDRPQARHFVQNSAEAPFLLGGNFTQVRIPGETLSVMTTPGSAKDAKSFLLAFKERRSYYQAWSGMPLEGVEQIFYFPMSAQFPNYFSGQGTAQGNMFFFQANQYTRLTYSSLQPIMSKLLFGDNTEVYLDVNQWEDYRDPENEYSIVQEIRSAILSLDQKEAYDKIDPTFSIQIMGDSPPSQSMALMINEAFSNGEADLVKRVLLRFLQQGLKVEDNFLNIPYSYNEMERSPYTYPDISWMDWLRVWKEEKAGEGRK